jgi:hypothetical protein
MQLIHKLEILSVRPYFFSQITDFYKILFWKSALSDMPTGLNFASLVTICHCYKFQMLLSLATEIALVVAHYNDKVISNTRLVQTVVTFKDTCDVQCVYSREM